jgi:hypothetical protein
MDLRKNSSLTVLRHCSGKYMICPVVHYIAIVSWYILAYHVLKLLRCFVTLYMGKGKAIPVTGREDP